MSGLLYPNNLPGLTLSVTRSPKWNTQVQQALTGKQSTIAYQPYPLTQFTLNYDVLRDNVAPSDLRALVGLFNAVQGRYDTFLFEDPDFNSVGASPGVDSDDTADSSLTVDSVGTGYQFGTGDGETTTFQLTAAFGNAAGPGCPEIIQNLNGTPTILIAGTPSSSYTIGPTGIVTFTTPPADGAVLGWIGNFYYRCRFDKDAYDWEKFMSGLWQLAKISFTSIIL